MSSVHTALLLGGLTFDVHSSWKEVEQWWDECPEYNDLRKQLDEPSGLDDVDIIYRHFNLPRLDMRWRILNFSGTTVRQAIQKILRFYTHKTYRREIGDHTFFEGIKPHRGIPRLPEISLSS
jgi:hypothetical protein